MENYTAHQVSKMFHLHPETVRRKLKQQEIKGFKVGRKWLVSQEEIERLRDTKERQTGMVII